MPSLAHWPSTAWRRLEAVLGLAGHGRARRAFFLGASACLLGAVLLAHPVARGDASEYQLMAESWLRHASPDVRPADVIALAARERRYATGVCTGSALLVYFEGRDGRWYCYHFWGYSLLGVPLKALLRAAGANDLRAPLLVNALVFLLAVHQVLFASGLRPRAAWSLALFALLSPAVWFVLWIHTEALSFSCVLLALTWAYAGHRVRPVVAASLGAMQNAPLIWLVAVLGARAAGWPPDPRRSLRAALAVLPAVLPVAFSLAAFGTPSILAREAADAALLSWDRAGQFFFDLNLGMLPYAPIPVALALVGFMSGPRTLRQLGWRCVGAAVLLVTALSASVTTNWNHGTAGPSRYTVWMLPAVLWMAADACSRLAESQRRAVRVAGSLALVTALTTQAALLAARGGLVQGDDSAAHSYAARLALHYVPAWYNPPAGVFVVRTLGIPVEGDKVRAVYRDGRGCRKAWLRAKDAEWLRGQCGFLPAGTAEALQRSRPRRWLYVDF